VGLLELARHWLEVATARGTHLIRLVQLVDDFHDGKRPLLVGTVAGTGHPALLGRLLLLARSPLGGVAKERFRAARELLLEKLDLELKASGIFAARLSQLCNEVLQATEEPSVLLLQQQRRLPQPLDVRLRRQVQQGGASWRNGEKVSREVGGGESRTAPASVLPSRKSASSLSVISSTPSSPARHSGAKRPRSKRFW
jgi:hypothetical protein